MFDAINNYNEIKYKCMAFNNKLVAMAEEISGEYADYYPFI